MMSFSFFLSAAVIAVRVRSLLLPGPQPCMAARDPPSHISPRMLHARQRLWRPL